MSGIPAGAGSLLGKRLGKFEILALLALGGTAEIYLARIGGAAGFEKYVVVKCLHDHLADDPEFVKMFLDEARLAAQLDHSNIVQTMELGEHENRYYMVMEFLAGLSLAMVVRRATERLPGGRIPVPLVLNMMAQACAGLHYAHEKTQNGKPLNIVHRDISPQNLVVSFEGVVKVVDFGIAKAEHRETRTRSGTIKGKFAYMSPEQCVAQNVDRRTDVFALGVITHELLTGRRLFKKPSPYETYQAVIECNVDTPSSQNVELDPALDPIVMKACAKEKEARYPTAEAFGDALAGYLHHRGKGSGPGEVSRFFDTSFAQELDEHSARMRELISGRVDSVDIASGWDEEEEKRRNETVDLGARMASSPPERPSASAMSLLTSDLIPERPSIGSLTSALDDLDEPSRNGERSADGDNGDDMPAERTRIEANPLERIEQLDAVVKKQHTPKPELVVPTAKPGAVTARPHQAVKMPHSGPLPLPAPPVVAPAQATPAKFPALANLATQIAGEKPPPELARTELAGKIVEPDHEPPEMDGLDFDNTVLEGGSGLARNLGIEPAAAPSAYQGMAPLPAQVMPPSGQLAAGPPVMASYPVMNKHMSQQIATGATVFPSERGGSGPRSSEGLPRAFDAVSPVGAQYPDGTDWAAAAATPARAIPPWLLVVLFVGALGLALGLTIAIAKLAG